MDKLTYHILEGEGADLRCGSNRYLIQQGLLRKISIAFYFVLFTISCCPINMI